MADQDSQFSTIFVSLQSYPPLTPSIQVYTKFVRQPYVSALVGKLRYTLGTEHDLHAQLVHTQAGPHVTHAWIRGKCVFASGRHTTLNVDRTVAKAEAWASKIGQAG